MYVIFVILALALSFGSTEDPCPSTITCQSSETPDSCPKNTAYREKVKLHGCCPGCVPVSGKDQPCQTSKDCLPGFKCSSKKCELDSTQACEYYKIVDTIWKKTKYWNPVCLQDGTFAPKQCKGEKMSGKCFCVNKMGTRIFGEEEWSKAENMTCGCSSLLDEMNKSTWSATYHCDRLGNFQALQCNNKICWCSSPKTGLPYSIVVPKHMMFALPCYNKNKVGEQYYRQCDSMKQAQEEMKTLLKNHGTKEITLSPTNCNFDGSYHRVQALREKTRCVFDNNFPLTEAVSSDKANCNCAYDRHIAKIKNIDFISNCESNGDYVRKQTWNGRIFCVDQDGFPYSDDPDDCS